MLTAGTGAAIRDIHTTINSRYPLAEQVQINTLVQGEQAKNDIVEKIQQADQLNVDTIIIGRGGGSIEDLWNFNEEDVVKAIYFCETPIISAVGHETDFTLSDFVADVRAATPTQAAVMATPDQYELRQYLKQTNLSLTRFIKQHMQQQRKHLEHVSSYYKFQTPTLLYDQQIQKRDDLEKQLSLSMNLRIKNEQQQLQLLTNKFNLKNFKQNINREQLTNNQKRIDLNKVMNNFITNQQNKLTSKLESLNNLSPTNTMLRGYTIVNKDDDVITSTNDLAENDNIVLTMKDGVVDAQVKKVRCKDE
ncbi:exodeoxyribonuclease VII large subunit [Staphylococcus sp. AntiMn-1]|nr:exodeoxyribonuclease VII large subunit [Staphylococcus sp. AntiMn-1]